MTYELLFPEEWELVQTRAGNEYIRATIEEYIISTDSPLGEALENYWRRNGILFDDLVDTKIDRPIVIQSRSHLIDKFI